MRGLGRGIRLLLCVCCVGWIGQLEGSIAAAQQAQAAVAGAESRVEGLLIGADQQADAGERILLIKVRLLDLTGSEVQKLPPKGTAIVDALVTTPVATAQTDGHGSFMFKAVPAGRYTLGVTTKAVGAFAAADVTLLDQVSDTFDTVVFDVASGQQLGLGSLVRRSQ